MPGALKRAMSTTATKSACGIRPLRADDIETIIAIDRVHSGRVRRSFFEKRFVAARLPSDEFVDIGATRDGVLLGFAMARILTGEFGRARSAAMLDGLGVAADSQGSGLGRALMLELIRRLRDIGVRSLHSQAAWTNADLLRFFAAAGFELAPRLALERAVFEPLDETPEEV
jgi:GNAT superfamily N-acetyltransferase